MFSFYLGCLLGRGVGGGIALYILNNLFIGVFGGNYLLYAILTGLYVWW